MITLTILDDEYIDRPKLTEPKKPFEYIVLPPIKRCRYKNQLFPYKCFVMLQVPSSLSEVTVQTTC